MCSSDLNEISLNDLEEPTLYCCAATIMKMKEGKLQKVSKNDISKNPLSEDPVEPTPMPYIIGFFDVLGFKNKLKKIGLVKMLEIYQDLMNKVVIVDTYRTLQNISVGENLRAPMLGSLPVRYSYASDTILLWIPLVPEFIAPFTARCTDLIIEALKMDIPLRGSLSIGEAVMNKDKSIYIGEPIVEAANLEKIQNWIGVSFGNSTTWPEFQKELNPNYIMHYYNNHLKKGKEIEFSQIVLDWPRRWREKNERNAIDKLNVSKAQLPKIFSDDPALPEGCDVGDIIKIEKKNDDKIDTYYRVVV